MMQIAFIISVVSIAIWSVKKHIDCKKLRAENETLKQGAHEKTITIARLQTQLEETEKYHSKQRKEIQEIEAQLKDTFKAISSDVLVRNNQSFLELAKQTFEKYQKQTSSQFEHKEQTIHELFKPMKESLQQLDKGMRELEKERKVDHEKIQSQMHILAENEKALRQETNALVHALKTPVVRGQWGEMQLKRVFELAGMLQYCDFYQQCTASDGESKYRPDAIVRLAGEKQIIVDAKVPLNTYLEALDAKDEEEKKQKLLIFAGLIRRHIAELGKKAYWQKFENTPEFVILFIPAETFYDSALQADPSLIEAGVKQGVIVATPVSLIALLRVAAYGWKQEALSENAKKISEIGHELYQRITKLTEHFDNLGKNLEKSVNSYNQSVGSLENRVLVSARKLHEIQSSYQNVDIPTLTPIDSAARRLQAKEFFLDH